MSAGDSIATPTRIAAGLVAAVAWAGMAVQFEASRAELGAIGATLWVMLRYFTIIANLLAAIVLSGIALGKPRFLAPVPIGGTAIAMLLVGVVYALLLRGMLELSGGAALADFLLHTVTPILVPLFWLAFAPKGALRPRDAAVWAVLPLGYYVYALARGAVEGSYAYPFMNVARLGWEQTLVNAAVMAAGFLLTGLALVWIDGKLARRLA